ncbi:coenzyme F420-0:L-glutamate ligase [soil metagenome]
MSRLEIVGITGLPEVTAGVDLSSIILAGLQGSGYTVAPGDVLVVTQKIVSKAEGCEIALDTLSPCPFAMRWAVQHGKDPRLIELTLREAARIVRMDKGVLITETRHGFVCANSGVDASNARDGYALTLPENPDASACRLRDGIRQATGVGTGIIISDTFGRPWREGLVNVAIGVAGVRAFEDYRGQRDTFGRPLVASVLAVADEIASAAELVMAKTARIPVALVRGMQVDGNGTGQEIIRRPDLDLFR